VDVATASQIHSLNTATSAMKQDQAVATSYVWCAYLVLQASPLVVQAWLMGMYLNDPKCQATSRFWPRCESQYVS
jgi:hypothetical protein